MTPLQNEKTLGTINHSVTQDRRIAPNNYGEHPGGPVGRSD
jgi:hypothetical protein